MKHFIHLTAAALLITSLSGCIVVGGGHSDWSDNDWESEQRDNREIINQLSLKSTRSSVLNLLGAPNFSEAFALNDDEYRVLYYRTQHRHSDGETTKDETTPLIFKNDQLIGWGEDVLYKINLSTSKN